MRPAPDADERRLALLVATTAYRDPTLRQLRAPAHDAEELSRVLAEPGLGGFDVTSVIDGEAPEIRLALEDFLTDRRPDDLLLLYFSCHGLVDARRRLYFVATDTYKNRLAATGVEASWLLEQLEDCRARRQVVILDCCFSGAFAGKSKGDGELGLGERFHGGGRGRVVLTASRATEYSFEGDPVPGSVMPGSVFTSALLHGIKTGEADLDRDGYISVDDAYAYAFDRIRASNAAQTPQRWLYGAEGDIYLARSPRRADPETSEHPMAAAPQVSSASKVAPQTQPVKHAPGQNRGPTLAGRHRGRHSAPGFDSGLVLGEKRSAPADCVCVGRLLGGAAVAPRRRGQDHR